MLYLQCKYDLQGRILLHAQAVSYGTEMPENRDRDACNTSSASVARDGCRSGAFTGLIWGKALPATAVRTTQGVAEPGYERNVTLRTRVGVMVCGAGYPAAGQCRIPVSDVRVVALSGPVVMAGRMGAAPAMVHGRSVPALEA